MRRLLASVVLLLTACAGGSDGSPPVTPPPTPTISVSLSSAAATATRGTTTTTTVTVARGGGYTGTVALSTGTLPAGITVTFAPSTLSGATTTSIATITVSATAATGSSNVDISATGSGVSAASASFALTVPVPAIAVAVGAPTATAVQGAAANVPVTVTRTNGYADAVALSATTPAGVTATFAPASIAAGSTTSTLVLAVSSTTAPGTYPITVTAAGTGVSNATTTVSLTVTAAGTPAIALSASPAALSVTAGQNGTSTITVARSGGFTGDATLAVAGAPAGMTATIAPSTVAANATTATLSIATTTAITPGAYTLTVNGTGTGVGAQSTAVTVTVAAPPGVTISAISAQQLSQGTSSATAIPLVLTRTGGLTGDLTMALEGAPAGVTATFVPNPATSSSSQMTLSATATAAPGSYTLTVRASGAGGVSGTTSFGLTMTAAATGSFVINTVPATVSVAQGQTGLSTVNIARAGGFTGAVTLTATGVPSGTVATFTPSLATGTQSQLGLDVGSGTAAGTYTITIRGQGTGVSDATTTLTLTVTPGGGGGSGNVNWTFCEAARFPVWFAVQNGTSGVWTRIAPSGTTTRVYTFTVDTRGGVAYAISRVGGGADVTVQYLSQAELESAGTSECISNRATKTHTGTVANVPAGSAAFIGIGGALGSVVGPGTTYTVEDVDDGLADLAAIRMSLNLTTLDIVPDRGILRRNVNYAAGSAIPLLDFTGSESFAVASADYTIGNANGETVVATMSFLTANGTAGVFSFPTASGLGTTQRLYGVPSSLTTANDRHQVLVAAFTGTGFVTSTRIIAQFNRDLVNRTLTLGPTLSSPTVTSLGTSPYVRFSATGTWQAEYGESVGAEFTQETTGSNSWIINASRNYVGTGASTWALVFPDFTGVAGFSAAWGMANASTQWSISMTGGTTGLTGSGPLGFAENGSFRVAERTGTVSP